MEINKLIFILFLLNVNHNINYSLGLDLEKLESLGIEGDFFVSDIAVYFNRAFLAIPRTVCQNNVSSPTLVEVAWKEFNVIIKSRFNKPIDGQIWATCGDLQNAIALAKEGVKSKLWILDRGNEFCTAKIMAYSMFHNSFLEEEKIELGEVPKDRLNSMVIENATTLGDHRAFIASAGDNTILVCYLKYLACDRIRLIERSHHFTPILADFLSISKMEPKIYLTGYNSLQVFSIEMDHIPEEYTLKNESGITLNASLLGDKLGLSSGLETDFKNGLIYYLAKDYAVVRWITDKPMKAEYHDVLAQSYRRLPYVSRLFTGPQGSVYALVNPFSAVDCQRDPSDNNTTSVIVDDEEETQLLPKRVVKIMKYSRLLDTFY